MIYGLSLTMVTKSTPLWTINLTMLDQRRESKVFVILL